MANQVLPGVDFADIIESLLEEVNEALARVRDNHGRDEEPPLLVSRMEVQRTMETSYSEAKRRLLGTDTAREDTCRTVLSAVLEPVDPVAWKVHLARATIEEVAAPAEVALTPLEIDIIKGAIRNVLGAQVWEPMDDRWRSNLRVLWQKLDGPGEPPNAPDARALAFVRAMGYPKK